jgi:hypothetical protein
VIFGNGRTRVTSRNELRNDLRRSIFHDGSEEPRNGEKHLTSTLSLRGEVKGWGLGAGTPHHPTPENNVMFLDFAVVATHLEHKCSVLPNRGAHVGELLKKEVRK